MNRADDINQRLGERLDDIANALDEKQAEQALSAEEARVTGVRAWLKSKIGQ